jgi:signal transduction histidine kinase
MSLNSRLAALGLVAVLFAVMLVFAMLVRVGLLRSRRPLRFKYRIQIFSLIWLPIFFVAVIFTSLHSRTSHFGWMQVLSLAGIAFSVAFICREIYRQRSSVLAEKSRQIAPLKFPPLLWPLVVVLAPLLVLGALAVWTLNSDRRSAQQEATARANEIASSVMSAAEDDLKIVQFETNGYGVMKGQNIITVNRNHELIQPRPWIWPPQPAPLTKDFSNLKSNKLAQWNEAESAFAAGEWKRAADLYLAFLNGRRHLGTNWMAELRSGIADSRFRPIALSRRAAAVEKSGDVPGAITAYNDIFDGFTLGPEAVSESGVGLAPLAVLKILDLAKDNPDALPEEWRRNPRFLVSEIAQNGPVSPISEEAIRRLRQIAPALVSSSDPPLTTDALFELWERSAEGRQFYAEATAQMGAKDWPDVFWSDGPEPWLAVKQTPPPNWPAGAMGKPDETIYAIIQYQWLFQQLSDRFRQADPHADFVINIKFAARTLLLSGGWSPRTLKKLFEVNQSREAGDMQPLQSASFPISLIIRLQDPEMYYRAVHRRQFLFSALIIGALVAGLVSAIVLRRSLIRQQSLNEQKSNFVSSVSHELRAPIASVRLMAESLERGKVAEGAKQNEYYRFIVQECRRLSSLIENVLDFSRIEQGRKQYEFEPTDVLALTRETVKLMEPYAEEKGVQLKLETPNIEQRTSNIEMEMDGRAIQQALVNLIDNAIKHSAKGQTVTIGLDTDGRTGVPPVSDFHSEAAGEPMQSNHSETGRMPVLLYVEDHGPGIPPAEHEKIFERFYRLGSELRRETQGVGIGLSIVRHIVEAHGGTVTVRSNIGDGSRFTVVLPHRRVK